MILREKDNRDLHSVERELRARIEALLADRKELLKRVAGLEAASRTQRRWLEESYAKQ